VGQQGRHVEFVIKIVLSIKQRIYRNFWQKIWEKIPMAEAGPRNLLRLGVDISR